MANRIVLPNWVRKRTRFKVTLLVTNGTKKLAKNDDRPIRIGTIEVAITEPDSIKTLAITTTLKKTSAKFAIPCEINNCLIALDIQYLHSIPNFWHQDCSHKFLKLTLFPATLFVEINICR